jgi:hypothetical protein
MGGYWLKYKKKGMAKLVALSLECKHISKSLNLHHMYKKSMKYAGEKIKVTVHEKTVGNEYFYWVVRLPSFTNVVTINLLWSVYFRRGCMAEKFSPVLYWCSLKAKGSMMV